MKPTCKIPSIRLPNARLNPAPLVKSRVTFSSPIRANARLFKVNQAKALLHINIQQQNVRRMFSTEVSNSIHSMSAKDINGSDVSLKSFAGKVLLIVNVASQCGLTKSNYIELQQLYDKHKSSGFEILAFPSNQFGAQEPGSSQQICDFARTKYKATFPLFEKIDVNGNAAHPLYKYLKQQAEENKGQDISWNFEKFLVDKDGNVARRYNPKVNPSKIEADIQTLLD